MEIAKLKDGICYAGLCDVFGGKMWYVDDHGNATWHWTQKEAEKHIRAAYKSEPPMRRALLQQLKNCNGRAYILN